MMSKISPSVASEEMAALINRTDQEMAAASKSLAYAVTTIYPADAHGCGGLIRVDCRDAADRVAEDVRSIHRRTKTALDQGLVIVVELRGEHGWIECDSPTPWVRQSWSLSDSILVRVASREIAERIVQSKQRLDRWRPAWIVCV